jgi:hypothetical protein
MMPRPPDRDAAEVDALVADRYLDALLEAADRRPVAVAAGPAPGGDSVHAGDDLDPVLRDAALVLRRSLIRVHPSFRFEERLAARLADLAAAQAPALAAAGGTLIPFPAGRRAAPGETRGPDPLLDAILRGDLDPSDTAAVDRAERATPDRRPLIVGGAAITSALSIVGVAIVAWRASRPAGRGSAGLMGRAARTAHARRAVALGIDLLGPA